MRDTVTKELIEGLAKDEMVYSLFFVSLISSDTILTIEDAERSMKILKETDKAIDEADITDELKKKFKNLVKDGIKICKKDIKEFKKVKLKDL